MKEHEIPCELCGEVYDPDELIPFDDRLICPECLENETTLCACCGQRIWLTDNAGFTERLYCKHDGSLSNGFELVAHPMSLEYHQEEMPWPEVLRTARSLWLQRPAQRDSGTRQESVQRYPFQGQIGNKKFALAHNVVLLNDRNDRLLQRSKNLPKTHIGTDSYIAVQLLETQKCPELQQPPKGGRTSSGHFCVYGLGCAGQCLIAQESLLLDKTAFVAY